jgi:hypothetical protein
MKIAICYRGISYKRGHVHKPGVTPFDIDFSHAIPYNEKYLIEPFRQRGDTVDIYFNTYASEKLDYFIERLSPAGVHLREFQDRGWGDWQHIWQLAIDSLEQVSGKGYDMVILFRFDLIPFVDLTTLYLPTDALSIATPYDDMFVILTGSAIEQYLKMGVECRLIISTHGAPAMLRNRGHKAHTIYGCEENGTHKLFGATANFFLPPTHEYYKCPIDDIFNPDSPHYGFRNPPMTDYSPC